jgi:hypothetical protein
MSLKSEPFQIRQSYILQKMRLKHRRASTVRPLPLFSIATVLLSALVAVFVVSPATHCFGCGGYRKVAPQIMNFSCSHDIGPYWTISGTVADSVNTVQGMVVHFGGVFASYGYTATVGSDGTFSVTGEFLYLQNGVATAQTSDWNGHQSNLALTIIAI